MIPCPTINSLPENGFIAGNRQTLQFECVDEFGVVVDLTDATVSIKLSPYGNPSYTVLSKNGSIFDSSKFSVILESEDTISLSGLYSLQPTVVDVLGNIYKPAQGTLFIQQVIN